MANDLLASFKAASRQYSHVVFNDRTQQFERAGKRHAVATFFGTANAKAKNNLTLAKIKEAMSAEVAEGGRFQGLEKDTDALFDGVKGDRRINSDAIRSIIRTFRHEAKTAPDRLREMKDAAAQNILFNSSPFEASVIDEHVRGMKDILEGYEGGYKVLEMMVRQLMEVELDGRGVDSSLKLIGEGISSPLAGNVRFDMINFFLRIGVDKEASAALLAIFRLVNANRSGRFSQMTGCELAHIVAGHRASPRTFNMVNALRNLLATLQNADSVQNAVVGTNVFPIHPESYDMVLDFCGWETGKKADCLNLLARQPVGNRISLLAAMKTFGGSRDVFLLQKLVGVQDKIKLLHEYGNLSPESVYRAIEGETADIPECIANLDVTVRAEEVAANYFTGKVTAEVDELLAAKGLDEGHRIVAQGEILHLMRSFGVSAEEAAKLTDAMNDARYAMFSGTRRLAVLDLKTMLGDQFDKVPDSVKYNLMTVPVEFRRPITEALMILTDGLADNERVLHHLVQCRDEIDRLWHSGQLTLENILQAVATRVGIKGMPEDRTQWSYKTVVEKPLLDSMKKYMIDFGNVDPNMMKLAIKVNESLEILVFGYGLDPEAARRFLTPSESVGTGVPSAVAHINPYYQVIGASFSTNAEKAASQLEKDLIRALSYQIAVELPGLNFSEVIEPEHPRGGPERTSEVKVCCAELKRILTGLCGNENQEQMAMLLLGMSQAIKLSLLPYAVRYGLDNLSDAFSIRHEIRAGENGDVKLRLLNLPDSRLTLDWTVTIHPDGVHEAAVPIVAPNQARRSGEAQ